MSGSRKFRIPWEVVQSDGSVMSNYQDVMSSWQSHFAELLNTDCAERTDEPPSPLLQTNGTDEELDAEITIGEIKASLNRAKNGKATGWDSIPVEVLRNTQAVKFLHCLFNKCFNTGTIPEVWSKSLISPIPKNSAADKRDPSSYRGITLASAVYKLYVGILNKRLSRHAESEGWVSDVQNGFRQSRGCVDHLNTLSQIIDTRKKRNLSTFVSFIDFSKAYDRISRPLLWYKLQQHGVSQKFMGALKSIYSDVKCCVKINGHNTDWFDVSVGLKQGCLISPLLFNLYIDDLTTTIGALGCGVPVEEETVSLLLYADDIALMATSENDLQRMLDCLDQWCQRWKLVVNADKSQVIHFRRGPSVPRTAHQFKCGTGNLLLVEKYRYLGLIFTEFLDLAAMSKAVAQAATRALGLVIAKCKAHGGVPHAVFSQLFDCLVQPILDYGSSIWGHCNFSHINTIQHRASRYFLGVGRYTPNNAVLGEMGWKHPGERCWKGVYRQFHRMAALPVERLNHRVHSWALRLALNGTKNAYYKVTKFAQSIGAWDRANQSLFDRGVVKRKLHEVFVRSWLEEINQVQGNHGGRNKLRTYKLLKTHFGTSHYVKDPHITRTQRSALAKFRCGVAPLRLETGRFEGIPENERLCPLCGLDVETELHTILKCPKFDVLRSDLFLAACDIDVNFVNYCDVEKLVFVLNNPRIAKCAARTCCDILALRRQSLYSS